jgi:hypothetical protein
MKKRTDERKKKNMQIYSTDLGKEDIALSYACAYILFTEVKRFTFFKDFKQTPINITSARVLRC